MTCGPTFARWLAAMILAIVALAPSVGAAHEGHRHGAHPIARAAPAATLRPILAEPAARDAALRSDPESREDARGPHGSCGCCGAACCASGILSAAVGLPAPTGGHAVLRPRDAPAAAGRGPDSLAEPPRSLA